MLIGDDFSAMHRLQSDEIYFYHSGAPLRMLLIDPDGVPSEVIIGPDALAGQHPQFHVPAYWWQGSSTDGPWSLVSTMVITGVRLAALCAGRSRGVGGSCFQHTVPGTAERIAELTRPGRLSDSPDDVGVDD